MGKIVALLFLLILLAGCIVDPGPRETGTPLPETITPTSLPATNTPEATDTPEGYPLPSPTPSEYPGATDTPDPYGVEN